MVTKQILFLVYFSSLECLLNLFAVKLFTVQAGVHTHIYSSEGLVQGPSEEVTGAGNRSTNSRPGMLKEKGGCSNRREGILK
jgi:hypothetical protein